MNAYVIRLGNVVIYRSQYHRAATRALARFKRTNKAVFEDAVLEIENRVAPRVEYTTTYSPLHRPVR